MDVRVPAAVALAALLLLAGCSLGGLGGPGADESPGESTDSPAAGSFTYPAGFDAGGVTNHTEATEGHREQLLAASGFTVTYDATVTEPGNTTTVAYTQQVETGSEEVHWRMNVSSGDRAGSRAQYYADDTVYSRTRTVGSDSPSYGNRTHEYALETFTGLDFVRPALVDVSYGSSETTTHGGVPAVVYSDASVESTTGLFGQGVDPANVSEFSSTLVVGDEGVVRQLRYAATVTTDGTDRTVEVTVTVSDVGSTTVSRPAWVSET